jgi:hypothetical protein
MTILKVGLYQYCSILSFGYLLSNTAAFENSHYQQERNESTEFVPGNSLQLKIIIQQLIITEKTRGLLAMVRCSRLCCCFGQKWRLSCEGTTQHTTVLASHYDRNKSNLRKFVCVFKNNRGDEQNKK